MKTVLIALAVVFTIPLLTFATLYLRAGKVVIVHNEGKASFETSTMIEVDGYMEKTESRVVQPKDYVWLFFYPTLKGPVRIRCVDGSGLALISPGPDDRARMLYSNITLDGCRNLVKRAGVAF